MSALIQPNLLRKLNERRVLETLQENGPTSRAGISRISGISAPTVSKAVLSLLNAGYLEELEAPATNFGRPAKLLRLSSDRLRVLGIVIDTTTCSIVTAGLDGKIDWSSECEFPTPETYDEMISTVVERAKQKIDYGSAIEGIGLSVPGLIDQRQQKCLFSPNLHSTDGKQPGIDLAKHLGIETVMFQESQALCLAEGLYGNAQGHNDFALLEISTGLGMGVMTGGRLLEGHSGLAGEIGHITVDLNGEPCGCGNRGCLETVACDSGFVRRISKLKGQNLSHSQIKELITQNDPTTVELFVQTCEYVAVAIAAAINILNPKVLLIHGKFLDAQDGLFTKIIESAEKRALTPSFKDCQIVQTQGGKKQGAVAAVIHTLTNSHAPALH